MVLTLSIKSFIYGAAYSALHAMMIMIHLMQYKAIYISHMNMQQGFNSDGKCSRQHVILGMQQEYVCLHYHADFGIKRTGACCPSQLCHVPGAEYTIQATAYHHHTYNADVKCSWQDVRLCRQKEYILFYLDTEYGIKRTGACCPSELWQWPVQISGV